MDAAGQIDSLKVALFDPGVDSGFVNTEDAGRLLHSQQRGEICCGRDDGFHNCGAFL